MIMKGKRTLVDAQYLTSQAVIDWSEQQGERKKHQTHKPRSHYWQRQAKNNILCALIFICLSAAGHLSLDERFIHSLFCDIEIGGCEKRKKSDALKKARREIELFWTPRINPISARASISRRCFVYNSARRRALISHLLRHPSPGASVCGGKGGDDDLLEE